MPVGTNFENSSLKASFSLSSLPPSTGLESPEHTKIKNERLYNSLTKKRKDSKHENWRRSWGSSCDNKDDFWLALQANYDYIMDNHLIDSCQDIDRDIQATASEETWNLNHLVTEFSEICTFLNDVQDAVYGKTENVTNWALRASHMEEMSRVSPRRKLFNDEATRLMEESPSVQDEVSWRLSHLNSKWEQVENALSTSGCSRCEQESCPDVEHEVKCLRKWVKEMESRLQPLNFHIEWTLPELEKKALEHMVLQRDIENHSKIVSSVVRLCNGASTSPRDAKCHASNARRVANGLERRYHLLFLRSLEWQCHIESLFKLHNNRDISSDADSDDEPCMKQPRLSSDYSAYDEIDGIGMSFTDTGMDIGSEPVNVVKVVSNNNSNNSNNISNNSNSNNNNNNNNNGNERQSNDIELNNMTTEDNQKNLKHLNTMNDPKPDATENTCRISYSENASKTNGHGICIEKSTPNKDKNTLQKIPVDSMNNSNTTAANIGSYYYKHRDTDSELDTKDSITTSEKDLKKEESSEDEFTYTTGTNQPNTENTEDKENIQLLVERVEELVSTPKVDPLMFHTEQQKSKLSRVKEWLNFETDKPIDSCDASGECTSGDSDEDKESQSSEDLNDSIVTCRPQQLHDSRLPLDDSQQNLNNEVLAVPLGSPETQKINFRPKRLHMKGNRPWSVSCLSQLSQTSPIKTPHDPLPNFSISESALHKLTVLSPTSVKTRSFATSTNSIGVHGNNSTSSTVEESGVMCLNEGSKAVSSRKKKMRFRRKHMIRKNESGSESQTCFPAFLPSPKPCTLVKSGSFSGSGSRMVIQERSTASDPSAKPFNRSKGVCDTSTTSGADSDDEKKIQKFPKFLLGPHAGIVNRYCAPNPKSEGRDSSPEKSSLNTTAEEQSSSLSEQAWDNYQEKYLSENYSEAHDSDAARRLLEFGEDYRCYLDSQSDCWSAHSQNHEYSPQFRRKPAPMPSFADSDSEIEDIKQYINESKAQLKYTKDIYDKHVAMSLTEFLVSSDCGEIIATCERHIYGLEVVIDANDDTKVLPDVEVVEVKALMSAWMDLKWSAKKMQSSRALYNEVISFKNDLQQYALSSNPLRVEVKSKEELTAEIDRLTEVQHLLQDKKRRLLELNVAVHRYIVNEDTPCYTNLKSEVSELYTLWNDTCQSVSDRLADLNNHQQIWAQLESRLDELQSDLKSDGQTLRLLDTALNGGVVSMEVASSVRDVAKVLSESQPGTQKTILAAESGPNGALFNRTLSLSLLTEGSFSDSGISDEGSEQELSEREHRLSAIRRLVRQLEVIMAPDSEARIKMTQRLEEAEKELRNLQSQCRGLIVRTAVCAEVQSRGGQTNGNYKTGKRKLNGDTSTLDSEVACLEHPDDDPDDEPTNAGSWFWRVVRASMPFQVALVALICMACLLEPSCCDSINNLNLSLTPQLRYVRGPPPV